MADEVIFDSGGTSRFNIKWTDPDGSTPRHYIRVALNGPVDFYVDTQVDLPGDPDVDILDWIEILFSVDLDVGASSIRFYLNGYNKEGALGTLTAADVQWDTAFNALTLGAKTGGTLVLGGSLAEFWLSSGYVDWSVLANREAFTMDGVPQDISNGGLYDAGLGVDPVLYIKGAAGVDGTTNYAPDTAGDFLEVGSVVEEGTYPIWPGSTLPTGSLDDDTFTHADAVLGDTTYVPPGGYGLQQQFFDIERRALHDAVGSTILQQMRTSPTNTVPLEIRSPSTSGGDLRSSLKGGVIKNTDAYDLALDTARTPAPVGVRTRLGAITLDGVRIHNCVDSFDIYRNIASAGPNTDQGDPETALGAFSSFELRNSWISYGRDAAIANQHFMSGTIEDCLIDGCYTFLRCNNPVSSVDQSENLIEIRNCLIWLRMLPYPPGHGGEALPSYPLAAGGANTAWGHGPIFDWHANAPRVEIYDSTFYCEYYPSTTSDNADWIANADDNLGFINQWGSKLIGASNNIIVWGGPGAFPGTIPAAHSSAFTTWTYDGNPNAPDAYFFTPRNSWLTAHPLLGKVGDTMFDDALDYSTFTNQPYADYPTF